MMEHRIETLPETLLIGMCLRMSVAENRTGQLWQRFMARRKEVEHVKGNELYSVQLYPVDYFQAFRPEVEFEKWAAIQVEAVDRLPEDMAYMLIPEGLYARFFYKGSSANGAQVFGWIFSEWLPKSAYDLDDRPHFEILGAKYKNNDPDSEEEIWIPVKKKAVDR